MVQSGPFAYVPVVNDERARMVYPMGLKQVSKGRIDEYLIEDGIALSIPA